VGYATQTLTCSLAGKDRPERKSILRGSGQGAKYGVGFGSALAIAIVLYQQPFDPVGDHPRHFLAGLYVIYVALFG